MARPKAVARLRLALLVLLVLLVAGIVGLYYFGAAGRKKPHEVATASENEIPGANVQAVGKDFEYNLDDAGRKVFSLKGKSYQMSRDQVVLLEDLSVTVSSASGEPYEMSGQKAVFDQKTQETEITGEVLVKGPSGIELRGDRLQMTDKGKLILSQDPVAFRYLDTAEGTSERMRFDLNERIFVLAGKTVLHSRPSAPAPFEVQAGRVFLDRNRHHARADFDVRVIYGPHRVKSGRVNLWLSEDDKDIQFVRALFGVQGRIGLTTGESGGMGPVRFSGETLSAVFAPEAHELKRFELAGGKDKSAVLVTQNASAPPRRLASGYITGEMNQGQIVKAEALGGVRLAELTHAPPEEPWDQALGSAESEPSAEAPSEEDLAEAAAVPESDAPMPTGSGITLDAIDEGAVRLMVGDRAEATFTQDGSLGEVMLYDKVFFRDPSFTTRALEARFDFVNGLAEFFGKPAVVDSPRGTLTAPRLLYTQRTGLLYAESGTRTELRQGTASTPLTDSPLGRGEGPIWVEAEEAFLRDKPRSFLYRGKVRAWRGDDLILADELKGDDTSQKLSASGHVRTVWTQAPGETTGTPAGTGGPVEVLADTMIYGKGERSIIYRGNVRSTQGAPNQGGRSLACEELTIALTEQQKAESLTCVGKVKIEDRTAGRTVEGDRAYYELAGRTVDVQGEKVTLKDRAGATVSGRRMIYEFGTGKAEVKSTTDPVTP